MDNQNNNKGLRQLFGTKKEVKSDPNSPPQAFTGQLSRSRFGLFDAWFSADPGVLSLFRITYGILLIINILRRFPYIELMYSREGLVPNKLISDYPFSSDAFTILTSFDGVIETTIVFYVMLAFAVLFTIGWKTRLFQILSALSLFSIHSKNILVENGGDQVMCIIMVWTLFLPLGKRFSIDALLSSLRSRPESTSAQLNDPRWSEPDTNPVWNLAIFACICQLATIYFFNTVSKHGPTWMGGTALYYILHMDRQITSFAIWCRENLPYGVSVLLTYGTLVVEGAAAPLMLSPIAVTWCRRIVIVVLTGLHVGIALWMNVGLFSWAMICAYPLLMTRADLDLMGNLLRRFTRFLQVKQEQLTIVFSPARMKGLHTARILRRLDRLQLLEFAEGENWQVKRGEKVYTGIRGWGQIIHSLPFGFLTVTSALALCLVPVVTLYDAEFSALMGYESPGLVPYMDWTEYAYLFGALYLSLRLLFAFEHRWAQRLFAALFPDNDYGTGIPANETPTFTEKRPDSRLRWAGFVLVQILVVFLMIIATRQMFATNDYFKDTFDTRPTQYSFASKLLRYPRMFNKWNMFAPNPPKGEGWVIIDACTHDGRNIDIQTRKLPHFAPVSFDRGMDWGQMWRIYTKRVAKKSHRKRRPAFRDYLKNIHRTNPAYANDRLKEFDVYWMRTRSPSPNQWYKPVPRDHWVYGLTGTLTNWLGTETPGKCAQDAVDCAPVIVPPKWVKELQTTLASWMRSEPKVESALDEDLYDQNPQLKPKVTCYKITSHHPKKGRKMSCKTNEGKSRVPKKCLAKAKDDKKKRGKGKGKGKGKTKLKDRKKVDNPGKEGERKSRIPRSRPARRQSLDKTVPQSSSPLAVPPRAPIRAERPVVRADKSARPAPMELRQNTPVPKPESVR